MRWSPLGLMGRGTGPPFHPAKAYMYLSPRPMEGVEFALPTHFMLVKGVSGRTSIYTAMCMRQAQTWDFTTPHPAFAAGNWTLPCLLRDGGGVDWKKLPRLKPYWMSDPYDTRSEPTVAGIWPTEHLTGFEPPCLGCLQPSRVDAPASSPEQARAYRKSKS